MSDPEEQIREQTGEVLDPDAKISLQKDELDEREMRHIESKLESAAEIADKASNIAAEVRKIYDCTVAFYEIKKEFDLKVKKVGGELELRKKKVEESSHLVHEQIESLSEQLDSILSQVQSIDPENCSEVVLEHRTHLLRMARDMNRDLQKTLISFMSI